WPGDPDRLALGLSAVGIWLTEDGGKTWRHGNGGIRPRYLPDDAPADTIQLCIHNLHRAPKRPERLFMQFHGGVYRSDDAGETCSARVMPARAGSPRRPTCRRSTRSELPARRRPPGRSVPLLLRSPC